MVTTWIPGKCIFLGYTNPNIQVQLTVFISVELQSSSKMLGRLPIFTFFVLVPPAPGSMLDKTKMVFVRNCCYMSQHWIGGAGGIQEKKK